MLIIPEIKTVLIFVPRTGSGTLRDHVLNKYSRSMMLYRHMEADGIPQGYDRWQKIGVVRHPIARLWSLYNFQKQFVGSHIISETEIAHNNEVRLNVADKTFEDWLINSYYIFSKAEDTVEGHYFHPFFSKRHALPENRLSQFQYLRPDLGTRIWRYQDLNKLIEYLGCEVDNTIKSNATKNKLPIPPMTPIAINHINNFCSWDLSQGCDLV